MSPTQPESWIEALWLAADRASWVSPQLAVAAWRLDPSFIARARDRVLSRCAIQTAGLAPMSWAEWHSLHGPTSGIACSAKFLSTLLFLLEEAGATRFVSEQRNLEDVAALLAEDTDGGERIARYWVGSLRANGVW